MVVALCAPASLFYELNDPERGKAESKDQYPHAEYHLQKSKRRDHTEPITLSIISMMSKNPLNGLSCILLIVGGLNWGLVGLGNLLNKGDGWKRPF